jgi:rod shape-determining protein MreC
MKLLFGQTISLQLRLFVAVLLSIVLIAGDKFTQGGTVVRTSLNTLVSPLIYVANLPYEIFSLGAKSLHTRDQLLSENEALKKKQMLQSEQLQQYQFLARENQKLRALLGGLKIGIAAIARFVAFAFFSALRFHSVTDRGYAGF